jgi:hypothetical protein
MVPGTHALEEQETALEDGLVSFQVAKAFKSKCLLSNYACKALSLLGIKKWRLGVVVHTCNSS